MSLKQWKQRVDYQVSCMVAFFTLFTCITSMYITYEITYSRALSNLSSRVYSLYSVVNKEIDRSIFYDFNSNSTTGKNIYTENKYILEHLKTASGAEFLYTIKENRDGEFVYVIDTESDAKDLYQYGTIVDEDILENVKLALTGKIVSTNSIDETKWGHIYTTFFPIYDDSNYPVGAVCIEFDATGTYNSYRQLRFVSIFVSFALCVISSLISRILFRRISNPNFKDGYNTDSLTQLKNRNSYEVDTYNLSYTNFFGEIGIIVIDMNKLKLINDTLGHKIGDKYIKCIAEILRDNSDSSMTPYRIGGDEFTIIYRYCDDDKIKNFIKNCNKDIDFINKNTEIQLSIAIGYAIHNENDNTLSDTFSRADKMMYEQKRFMHENNFN